MKLRRALLLRLKTIPVVGIVDTNCDQMMCNIDAIQAAKLITSEYFVIE